MGSSAPFSLRILRPEVAGRPDSFTYTGAGTSSPQTPLGSGIETFTTSLPIQAGDVVGLDGTPGGEMRAASVPGGLYRSFYPPVPDGGTRSSGYGFNVELGFNADVEPSSSFVFRKIGRNLRKGTARLVVEVPNPGIVSLAGRGIVTQGRQRSARSARASRAIPSAGRIALRIKARGKKQRALNRTGKAKVTARVTFTPRFGAPSSKGRELILRKRR